MHFPEYYINNIGERVRLYRELDNVETEQGLQQFEEQLVDRFGPLPAETDELLMVVRLRWLAMEMGFEKIILKNEKMIIHFIADQESEFYKSGLFMSILQYVQSNPRIFTMKEGKNKLTMSTSGIESIFKAYDLISNLAKNTNT